MRRQRSPPAIGPAPNAACRLPAFQGRLDDGVGIPNGADQMDTVLHADRLEGRGAHQRKRTYWEQMARLQTVLSFILMGRPGSYGMASYWSGQQVGIGGDGRLYLRRFLSKS